MVRTFINASIPAALITILVVAIRPLPAFADIYIDDFEDPASVVAPAIGKRVCYDFGRRTIEGKPPCAYRGRCR